MGDYMEEKVADSIIQRAAKKTSVDMSQIDYSTGRIKRTPLFVLLFEFTNAIGCLTFCSMIFFNIGGLFFPKGDFISSEMILACMRHMAILTGIFAVVVGIPLLLLFVDCFVIMKGVKGFKFSIISILSAPASYPIVRTMFLKDPVGLKAFHITFGTIIFASNSLTIACFIYYIVRIVMLSSGVIM